MAYLCRDGVGDRVNCGIQISPNPGTGRVNFGFTVRQVPNTTPIQYKGQILLMNNGKWRLKGTLSNYGYVTVTVKQYSASGTGNLYWWNLAANGGLGDWALSQANVNFTITFVDNGQGGKNATPDTFGIKINHVVVSPPEPSTLPNSNTLPLKGGNIDIK